jgi:hypothetical protein
VLRRGPDNRGEYHHVAYLKREIDSETVLFDPH